MNRTRRNPLIGHALALGLVALSPCRALCHDDGAKPTGLGQLLPNSDTNAATFLAVYTAAGSNELARHGGVNIDALVQSGRELLMAAPMLLAMEQSSPRWLLDRSGLPFCEPDERVMQSILDGERPWPRFDWSTELTRRRLPLLYAALGTNGMESGLCLQVLTQKEIPYEGQSNRMMVYWANMDAGLADVLNRGIYATGCAIHAVLSSLKQNGTTGRILVIEEYYTSSTVWPDGNKRPGFVVDVLLAKAATESSFIGEAYRYSVMSAEVNEGPERAKIDENGFGHFKTERAQQTHLSGTKPPRRKGCMFLND